MDATTKSPPSLSAHATIPGRALFEALTGLKKIIPRKSSIPALSAVFVELTPDGMRLTCTDLDHWLRFHASDSICIGSSSFLLDHAVLYDLVRNAKNHTLCFEPQEDGSVFVSSVEQPEVLHRSLSSISLDEFPDTPPSVPVKSVSDHFLPAFRECMPFCSRDPNRLVLNGVYIEKEESACTLVGTDGRRLNTVPGLDLPLDNSRVVPAHAFLAWKKLPAEDVQVGASGGQFRMIAGAYDFQCKCIDGKYPAWRQVIPTPTTAAIFTLDEEDVSTLLDALKMLPVGGEQSDSRPVSLVVRGGVPNLAAREASGRWSFVPLARSSTSGTFGTCLNRRFLLDAVKAGYREFHVGSERDPLLARKGDANVHVLMPLRGELPKTEKVQSTKTKKPEVKTSATPSKVIYMPKPEPNTVEPVDLQASFQALRDGLKELNTLSRVLGEQIRVVRKAERAREQELQNARGVLKKLQAVSL